jgi:hypothetical protein
LSLARSSYTSIQCWDFDRLTLQSDVEGGCRIPADNDPRDVGLSGELPS